MGEERCNFVHIPYYYFSGIRSVSFKEDVLTIGTGGGSVHFFDLRANKYLELNCGHTCALTVGEGWLVSIFVIIVNIVNAVPSRIGEKPNKVVSYIYFKFTINYSVSNIFWQRCSPRSVLVIHSYYSFILFINYPEMSGCQLCVVIGLCIVNLPWCRRFTPLQVNAKLPQK